MKVLVVDDSLTMRKIIIKNLSQIGFEDVIEAADGEEALAKLKANPKIELILSDWNMPTMDGYQFLVEFRKTNKNTPFIMVTTEAEKPKIVQAIQAGVNNYILKPFTNEQLQEKIKQATHKKAAN